MVYGRVLFVSSTTSSCRREGHAGRHRQEGGKRGSMLVDLYPDCRLKAAVCLPVRE